MIPSEIYLTSHLGLVLIYFFVDCKLGQKIREGVVFTGGSFRRGVRVPIGVPGGGGSGQVQVGGRGVVCSWEMREKGKGAGRGGGGAGTGKGTSKSLHTHLSKLPFSKLRISLSASLRIVEINVSLLAPKHC